jgi:hypothetical protein
MNAAGKTSPIFSFGTNIRYLCKARAMPSPEVRLSASVVLAISDINSRAGNFIATYFF